MAIESAKNMRASDRQMVLMYIQCSIVVPAVVLQSYAELQAPLLSCHVRVIDTLTN